MEAYPENYPTDRLCCGGAEDGYKENLILESEEEDEEGVEDAIRMEELGRFSNKLKSNINQGGGGQCVVKIRHKLEWLNSHHSKYHWQSQSCD
uniref:Uncharacterized protein n=1 Tax=Cucumis melo TaxID=3656 RepID=A0A9I9EA64_CUCME